LSFIDDLAQLRDEISDDGGRKRVPRMKGLTIGRVINLLDPLCLGRVQVRVPSIDGLDLFPYARVITPGGSFFSGIYWIPNIEDEVLVLFEDEDPDAAYILGGVWGAVHMPPLPSPLPQVRTIRSPLGNQIVFTDLPGVATLTLQSGITPPVAIPSPPSPVGPMQTISLNPLGIQIIGGPTVSITCGANTVVIGPQGVSILTPGLFTVTAGASVLTMSAAGITLTGPQVSITGAGAVTLNAGAAAAMTAGGAASITAAAAVTATAAAALSVTGAGAVLLTSASGNLNCSPTTAGVPKPIT
jgi:hypothetical protein